MSAIQGPHLRCCRIFTGAMGNEDELLDHLDARARDQKLPACSAADVGVLFCLRTQPPSEGSGEEEEETETKAVIKEWHRPLCIPNGITWSNDNCTMFMVDSCARAVYAFDYDYEEGSISE